MLAMAIVRSDLVLCQKRSCWHGYENGSVHDDYAICLLVRICILYIPLQLTPYRVRECEVAMATGVEAIDQRHVCVNG